MYLEGVYFLPIILFSFITDVDFSSPTPTLRDYPLKCKNKISKH